MASAPAAKRASEQSIVRPSATRAPAIGPQHRDPKRYQVLSEHGRGGLGRVSRAHDRELDRDVAIKELISRNDIHEVRFLREALITARLEHPGIVPVHEAGRWPDGTPFYAMKLVSGRSLRELIAECATSDQRIGLLHHVIAVADAIAYAHGRNIIHRDLKPANIIVGEFGETIVIDWGLAKDLTASDEPVVADDSNPSASPLDEDLTVEGSVLGTPAYMAPEQGRGEAVDQRADVFAIGTMLWELCAARRMPPSTAEGRHRVLRRAGIDQDLITIIDNALDPDKEKRYPDAGALAADLKAFKSGARIAARDYTLWAMLAHWTRRHRAVALSVTTAILVAATGIVGFVRNIARERDRADTALVVAQQERDRSKLSEASLVLDRDPNRAMDLLASFSTRTPQVAMLTSRARQRAATHIISTPAGVNNLFRARDGISVEVRMSGELASLDPRTGILTPLDRDLTEAFTYRDGQPLYVRRPSGARGVRIATPSNINAIEAGELDSAAQLVALAGAAYVLDKSGDLHLLDGKGALVIDRGIHGIAGDGELLLVCRSNGELEFVQRGATVMRRRCAQTKSRPAMAVSGNDYAALSDDGTLLLRRGGRSLEIRTDVLGEYELALSNRGGIAIVDYVARGKTWFVRPDGTRLEAGPIRVAQPYGVAADGNLVAWGYADGTAVVLDTTTGMSWNLHGHTSPVGLLVVDSAHGQVVTASGREIRVWDIKPTSSTLIAAMPCSIFHIEPSPDGSLVALDCNDGSVSLWSRRARTLTQLHKHVGYSYGLQWVRGKLCSGGWGDGRVQCSKPDGTEGELLDSRSRMVSWLAATPDHRTLVFGGSDGKVWRFDRTLQELFAHNERAFDMAISSDGRLLASCAQDGSLVAYDLAENRLLSRLFSHVGVQCSVAWIGRTLWSSGLDGTLKQWVLRDGGLRLKHVLQGAAALRLTTVVPGRWAAAEGTGVLLVGNDEASVNLRIDTGGNIDAVAISPDRRYAVASANGELVIVDVERSAITTLTIGSTVQQLRFLDPELLAFSEPTALKTVQVGRLEYVTFQRRPDPPNQVSF